MRQIRFNTFETNSSSTHSIAIFTEEEYSDWVNNRAYIDYNDNVVSEEKAHKLFEEYCSSNNDVDIEFEDWVNGWDSELWDIDHWYEDLEQDHTIYTTRSNEVLHICCAYGYD